MAGRNIQSQQAFGFWKLKSVKDEYMGKPLLNKGLRDIVLVRDREKLTNRADGLFRMV